MPIFFASVVSVLNGLPWLNNVLLTFTTIWRKVFLVKEFSSKNVAHLLKILINQSPCSQSSLYYCNIYFLFQDSYGLVKVTYQYIFICSALTLDTELFYYQFFQRHEFDIPKEVIEGTIHSKPNAAALLMEKIYFLLTNRK